jgi:sulfotransferase
MNLHFISGLPRSGSTLLRALLGQNPRFRVGISSPLFYLMNSLVTAMSADTLLTRLTDEQRGRVLLGVIDGIYGPGFGLQASGFGEPFMPGLDEDRKPKPEALIFDTNRLWTGRLPLLKRLLPACRMICCVRNPAWVLDSYERLYRKNPLRHPCTFGASDLWSVYARAEVLMNPARGAVGMAWRALRDAWHSAPECLILVEYDKLVAAPHSVMRRIHEELGEEDFFYDYENVGLDSSLYGEIDDRAGLPGLHRLRGRVQAEGREPVIPPDLFAKYKGLAFWETSSEPGIPRHDFPSSHELRIKEA